MSRPGNERPMASERVDAGEGICGWGRSVGSNASIKLGPVRGLALGGRDWVNRPSMDAGVEKGQEETAVVVEEETGGSGGRTVEAETVTLMGSVCPEQWQCTPVGWGWSMQGQVRAGPSSLERRW